MTNKEAQFKDIVRENGGRIKRICSYYAPDTDEQKDIYQEVLINIWKSLDNFRGEAAISTWIYRIAVNTSLSYMGKSFKKMRLHLDIETMNLNSLIQDSAYQEKVKSPNIASIGRVEHKGNCRCYWHYRIQCKS